MEGPADYALLNGLTVDFLDIPSSLTPTHDLPIASSLDEGEIDDSRLPGIWFREIIPPKVEYITGYEESVGPLLKSCVPLTDKEVEDATNQACFPGRETRKELMFELPILRSDHHHDCEALSCRVEKMKQGPLPHHNVPLEPADEENGGGLEFPRSAKELDKKLMGGLEEGKTLLDKDFVQFLQDTLKTNWTKDDQRDFMESVVDYRGVGPSLYSSKD
jgi:hypothetical protein